MALNDRQVVIIVPDGWTNFTMMELKHPKSKTGKMFALNAEKTDLAEVISIDDPYAAWFIGDTVEPDGRLQMLTSMDPLLLALPYLRSAERTVPLDHLLTDDDFPHVSDLVEMLSPDKMNKVANPKGTPDLNVWQWNESKTLEYLGQKIQRLTAAIQAGDLHLQGQSENYLKRKNESESMEECKKAAWEFLSDYLQEDLSLLLAKKLKIDLEKTSSPKKPKTNSNVNETKSSNGPKDDYTKNFNKALLKNTPEQNSKQKALAKSAKGTKNISSFFSKK